MAILKKVKSQNDRLEIYSVRENEESAAKAFIYGSSSVPGPKEKDAFISEVGNYLNSLGAAFEVDVANFFNEQPWVSIDILDAMFIQAANHGSVEVTEHYRLLFIAWVERSGCYKATMLDSVVENQVYRFSATHVKKDEQSQDNQ